MNQINNFILSKHIVPILIEKMQEDNIPLSQFSSVQFLVSRLNPTVHYTFDWSEIEVSYQSLNNRYSITFIIYSQPKRIAQSKYGVIVEDLKAPAGGKRLTYFTLEESISLFGEKRCWMVCTVLSNGNHRNYGTLEGLPTPYNFVKRVCEIVEVQLSKGKTFLRRLFCLKPKITIEKAKPTICVISQNANMKICNMIDELKQRYVDIGIMLGHYLDNGAVLIVDCFLCGPRRIEEGFGYDHIELNQKANEISKEYAIPLSFLGFIHSQPVDYLSNTDEITVFNNINTNQEFAFHGIISYNPEIKTMIYEFHQQSLGNSAARLWDYSIMPIEIDKQGEEVIPAEYLSRIL